MTRLNTPRPGREGAEAFVADHLGHLVSDHVRCSTTFRGGQSAADDALAAADVVGYARRRNEVWPTERRGATRLSPYIRHGLLPLPTVWHHVEGGPTRDVRKFRDELLWQEFARHWYARLGPRTGVGVRRELSELVDPVDRADPAVVGAAWDRSMRCLDVVVDELHRDGWLVNQTRMWLASHWSVRLGRRWRDGEDYFFTHLLDGSRAANRLGWQWTTGVGSSKSYSFTRWQVLERAPGLCDSCVHRDACPIEDWPADPRFRSVNRPSELPSDPDPTATAGPSAVVERRSPASVWLTAESLGDADPALRRHAELPVVFVFDEALLSTLRLSSKRLIFVTETLAELAARRDVELHLGDPVDVLVDRSPSVTFAPVPGFRRRAERIAPAVTHPWPWLVRPGAGSLASFSAWRRSIGDVSPADPDQPTLW